MASTARKPQEKAAKSPAERLVLERFLPYRLSVLSNRVSRAIAARYAEEFDLTIPEWRVIAVLGRRPNLTATQICDATEMDKVAVSRAVARLTKARRIAGIADRDDARRQLLALTSAGAALHAKIAPLALDAERRLLARLDDRKRAQLDALLDYLLDAATRL